MAGTKRSGLSYEGDRIARTIFKRCVQCPGGTPTCPDCPNGQICSLVPQDCYSCAHMTCIANPQPAPPKTTTNVGAIAGGVIGGVAFMALFIFIFWRFWIKKRREQQEMEAEGWEDEDIVQQKHSSQFRTMRSDAVSTRTRGSLANSILSRASNIIQIAYIPGVTNRNRSGENSLLETVPVPPIPAAFANTAPKSAFNNQSDALFFRPGSLRGSTYSDGSSLRSGNRDTKYSITPSLARTSIMSDVYRNDATMDPMPMPATQAMRVAPRMVAVKTSAPTSPSESMIASGSAPNAAKVIVPGQNAAAPLGSSDAPQRNGSGLSFGKATQITVGKGKGRFPVAAQNSNTPSIASTKHTPIISSPLVDTATDSEDDEEHARARRSLIDAAARAADPSPLMQPLESPFVDVSELQNSVHASATLQPAVNTTLPASTTNDRLGRGDKSTGGLGVISEEGKRESYDPYRATPVRGTSPFSDIYATK